MLIEGDAALVNMLAQCCPFIDLRAPAEFTRGCLPNSINLPLMTDSERHQVGLRFRLEGQASAVQLGHELVSGQIRAQRIASWLEFLKQHPHAVLFCWRGGLRSEVAQSWLKEAGMAVPRVRGGYKALRTLVLNTLQNLDGKQPWIVLGGRTGSGKTEILHTLANALDLEAFAHHRGSAFGGELAAQPSQITFENAVAARYLQVQQSNPGALIVEDEGKLIGRLSLPETLVATMRDAPLVLLEVPLEERALRIRHEYVESALATLQRTCVETDPLTTLQGRLTASLAKVQRRLGGERYQQILKLMDAAFFQQINCGAVEGHDEWIRELLSHYYDPMYEYQLAQKQNRIVFRGNREAVVDFLANRGR